MSFDFVIVVAEVPRRDVSIDPKRGTHIRKITKLGAGFWIVELHTDPYKNDYGIRTFRELTLPKRQQPHPENRKWIVNKFLRYVWGRQIPEDPNQQMISKFFDKT